jgi:hypothetical protein
LRAELGTAREGPARVWPAVGCAVGLLLGLLVAWLLGRKGQDVWTLSRTQAEVVFLLMIAGVIGGLIVRVLRTRSPRRGPDGRARRE